MKLKITSDGTSDGTQIINDETGEALEHITKIKWEIGVGELAVATVEFAKIPVELIGEEKKLDQLF